MAKSGHLSYQAVATGVVLLWHVAAANQPAPSLSGTPALDPQMTGATGGASINPSTVLIETIVSTAEPSGASTYTTRRTDLDKDAWKDAPGFVSAALNSFSDRAAQIPDDLEPYVGHLISHAKKASLAIQRYYIFGYNFVLVVAQSALDNWNNGLDSIAASGRWGDSLDSLPQPVRALSNSRSVPETGLLPGGQTDLAVPTGQDLWTYAGSTAQRTRVLFRGIVVRESRHYMGEMMMWVAWTNTVVVRISRRVAKIGRWIWDGLTVSMFTVAALLAVLVILAFVRVLMYGWPWLKYGWRGLVYWFRTAKWLIRGIMEGGIEGR